MRAVRICPNCGEENSDRARFCQVCATPLLRHVMERFFDTMRAAIERHGGVVEKFIGDAVMAVFGIPRLHEDDPIRAVRAAAAMGEALAELNEELQRERGVTLAIRTGITTGE